MSLVLGTNAGFVTTAPTSDPGGIDSNCEYRVLAQKDTCPANVNKITEFGIWFDQSQTGVSVEIGLYSHDSGNDEPDTLLFSSTGHTSSAGWLVISGLDWDVTPGTVYHLAVAFGSAANNHFIDYESSGGQHYYDGSQSTLQDPFVVDASGDDILSWYALVESVTPSNAIAFGFNF